MPNLNTFSTLNERVKKCRADYNLEDNSTAFMWLALETILQLNPDDIEDAITDGGQSACSANGQSVEITIAERVLPLFSLVRISRCWHSFGNGMDESARMERVVERRIRIFRTRPAPFSHACPYSSNG